MYFYSIKNSKKIHCINIEPPSNSTMNQHSNGEHNENGSQQTSPSPNHQPPARRASIDGHSPDEVTKIRYTTFVVRHPIVVQLISLIVIVVCATVIGTTGIFEIAEQSNNDYLIRSDIRTLRKLTVDAAYEAIGTDENSEDANPRTITDDNLNLFVMYTDNSGGEDMLGSAAKIELMNVTERILLNDPDYKEFCLSDFSGACTYSSYLSALTSNIKDPDVVQDLASPENLAAYSSLYFSPEFSQENPQSQNMRALFQFGFPLEDVDGEDETVFKTWIWDMHKKLEANKKAYREEEVGIYWFNGYLIDMLFEELIMSDFSFAIGSMIFVFLYMGWHTRSLYLSSLGIFQVVGSFVPGFFIYRLVFQVSYFQSLHLLAIFVILGIGADNVFVFTDAWNQMEVYPQLASDDELRLAMAFRRAAKMTLATSFTTFSAFMATGISKIMPIATFAYFASCVIICDYVLVLTFYTPGLIIKKRYIDQMCSCLRRTQLPDEESRTDNNVVDERATTPKSIRVVSILTNGNEAAETDSNGNPVPISFSDEGEQSSTSGSKGLCKGDLEKFFELKYAPFIRRYRFAALAVFFVGYAVMLSFAAQLQPQSEDVEWLPDDHVISKTIDLLTNGYQVSEYSDQVTVDVVWGLAGLNRKGTNPYKPSELGTVIWDDTFTLLPDENQEYLIDVCLEAELQGLLANIDQNRNCFIEDYRDYRLAMNQSFPATFDTQAELAADLQAFAYETENTEYLQFDGDGSLKFVKITFTIPLAWGQPYTITYPWYEKWEAFVNEMNSQAPSGVDGAIQTASGGGWCWMITERSFVTNLVQGMALAMAMAFLTLVLATQNVVLAFMAAFSISGIVACVLGSAKLLGWQLGIAESISGVILIGFSVDYVVHISELYSKYGKHGDRVYKTTQALKAMGITIVAGAITTFGSGVFLFCCQITFFLQVCSSHLPDDLFKFCMVSWLFVDNINYCWP